MTSLSAEAKSIITETHPAFVATADKAGLPNVSPKGSFRVLDDERVVFVDVHSPRTIANLRENPLLSAIVFDPATNKGCRIWGQAEIVDSGEVFDQINSQMASRGMQAEHVVIVSVDEFLTF